MNIITKDSEIGLWKIIVLKNSKVKVLRYVSHNTGSKYLYISVHNHFTGMNSNTASKRCYKGKQEATP